MVEASDDGAQSLRVGLERGEIRISD